MAFLSRYTYDPLDRLASCTPLAEAMAQRYYKAGQLVTEIQGAEQRTYLRSDSQLLAQKNLTASALLATDTQNSVLHAEDTAIGYTPYGHRETVTELPGLPGFNGEQPDPITGHYLLGNGYRAYNPTLMRFNSPDSLSPFGDGGLNAYAYCLGDPVNRGDPTGHMAWFSLYDDLVAALQLRRLIKNPVVALPGYARPVTRSEGTALYGSRHSMRNTRSAKAFKAESVSENNRLKVGTPVSAAISPAESKAINERRLRLEAEGPPKREDLNLHKMPASVQNEILSHVYGNDVKSYSQVTSTMRLVVDHRSAIFVAGFSDRGRRPLSPSMVGLIRDGRVSGISPTLNWDGRYGDIVQRPR